MPSRLRHGASLLGAGLVAVALLGALVAGPAAADGGKPKAEPTPRPYPLIPDDDHFGSQWGMHIVGAPEAWQVANATGAGITIAIVDSGIDLGHPDFACDGKLAVLPGSDVASADDEPQDEEGHGTHVAGIAAACTDNGIGVVGVAPDATLLPVRALGDNGDLDEAMADGIRFATVHGAHVINLSIGPWPPEGYLGPELYPATEAALEQARGAGVVVVAAAGNFSQPLCEFPALSRNVICVGATDRLDHRAYYSDLPLNVDRNADDPALEPSLVAPGGQGTLCQEGIVSTYLRQEASVCMKTGYDSLDGTSMASPHVAGAAALVYDRLGGKRSVANATTIVRALISTAEDLYTPGFDPLSGYGRLDAEAAVRSI